VADLHPDPAGFEPWLRGLLGRDREDDGVLLSTIHRVKGREWDRVAVFGVADGVVPHRLGEDVEEERRVLHVGITRGRRRVVVLADRTRPSPFLAEFDGTAPHRPVRQPVSEVEGSPRRGPAVPGRSRTGVGGRGERAPAEVVAAEHGRLVKVLGGYEGTVEEAGARSAQVRLVAGGSLTVRYGERVEFERKVAPLGPPTELWGAAFAAEAELRAWRVTRAKADGVPAYVVLNDAHLRGIALARPTTAAELASCDGIGPTKLERYGDEILAVLDQVPDEPA
jgi:DNA helicase-2/ATP-dependent DNA helicase PcrA